MPKRIRAAVIGSTGKGDYGHGLDRCFEKVEGVELVAIADDNPRGLHAAGKRLQVSKLYTDFRKMLRREKPDIVSVGPRWVDRRVEMVTAAAQSGCHIYCEKPFAGNLADADAMLAACEQAQVKIAVAHQFRAMAPVRELLKRVRAGKYGKLLRMRARPKDDHRGGGEELIVHGTHLLDLMVAFAGEPRWVSGHIAVGNRDAKLSDKRRASEPVGPVAGDSLAATFGFPRGVRGFMDSTRNAHRADRPLYGLLLECEEAQILIRRLGDVFVYPAAAIIPENEKLRWEKLWIEDWHFTPDHKPKPPGHWIAIGNRILVTDLLAAIRKDREPPASGAAARAALELIQGVYGSHFSGGVRVSIPQARRAHPLDSA